MPTDLAFSPLERTAGLDGPGGGSVSALIPVKTCPVKHCGKVHPAERVDDYTWSRARYGAASASRGARLRAPRARDIHARIGARREPTRGWLAERRARPGAATLSTRQTPELEAATRPGPSKAALEARRRADTGDPCLRTRYISSPASHLREMEAGRPCRPNNSASSRKRSRSSPSNSSGASAAPRIERLS